MAAVYAILAVVVTFGLLNLDWEKYVKYDARYERPAEVELLIGNPAKAKDKLGWQSKTSLEELCRMMVEADLRRNSAGGVSF